MSCLVRCILLGFDPIHLAAALILAEVMVNNTGLPFLPGNTFTDTTRNAFHKKQTFQKGSSGIPIIKDAPQGAPSPPVVPPPPQHEDPVAPTAPAVPAYVALDRMVLRFFAYFKEAVHESRMENYRVRKVTILYYLEDNTLQVACLKLTAMHRTLFRTGSLLCTLP